MTLNDVQRAALALFAARAAGERASLEQMKAICYCIRNRVKAGWYDGQWLTVMEHAGEASGNLAGAPVLLDPNNRILQRLVADIDDIYYGGRNERSGRQGSERTIEQPAQRFSADGEGLEEALGKCCYWATVNQPYRPWFQEHILGRPEEHPNRAQLGLMLFFE